MKRVSAKPKQQGKIGLSGCLSPIQIRIQPLARILMHKNIPVVQLHARAVIQAFLPFVGEQSAAHVAKIDRALLRSGGLQRFRGGFGFMRLGMVGWREKRQDFIAQGVLARLNHHAVAATAVLIQQALALLGYDELVMFAAA